MLKMRSFKKVLSVITSAAVSAGSCGLTAAVTAYTNTVGASAAYDINGDGTVDVSDIVAFQKYLVKKGTVSSDAVLDLNSDGRVNVFDLLSLKRTVVSTSVSDVNYIHLNENTISTEGKNMTLSESGTVVTVTSGGTYIIDGTLTEGQIRVEASDTDKVTLILSGANVTCSTGAPLYVANAASTVLSLSSGTVNTLNDSESYSGTDAGSTVYTDDPLTVTGSGLLTVQHSSTLSGAAILGNSDISIESGTVKVTSAADTNDEGADGIVSKGGSIFVSGGTVDVNSKGGDAFKASSGDITVSGGTVTAKSEADALQASGYVDVDNAVLYAYGKRGITAGSGYTIDSSEAVITANEAVTDTSGISVSSMLLNYTEKMNKSAISVRKNGTEVYSVTPDKKYTYALLVDPALADGTYTVYTGDVQMTHAGAASEGQFVKSGTVSVYDSVAAVSGQTVTPVTNTNSITLSDSGITVTGTGAALSSDRKTVTITEPGTYTVTGEMTDGQIVVDADKTAYPTGVVELSLEGMSLTNTSTSPIYVAQVGDECAISAKKGTVNTISDGTSYTNDDSDTGAVYSKDDLKIKGKGTLNVYGNCADAIVSKDDIKINNGTVNVTAVDDGIRGKESVKIGNETDTDFSSLNVTVETKSGDGIKTTEQTDTSKGSITINGGTVKVTSNADGIQAERDLVINGGDLDIYTYQGSSFGGNVSGGMDGNPNKTDISAKGLKAGDADASITGTITVNGGTINVDSSDDSVHCNGNLTLNGGALTLASADDGLHSDADLTIGDSTSDDLSDVTVYISKSYEGVEGMNINQNSGSVIVNATDDGYNAAGGADGSGTTTPGGWGGNQGGPGGRGGMGGSTGGNYSLNIKGGLALVNCSDGDHDGFDSNGSLTISGGYAISNGNEAFDSDGTKSYTGGVYVTNTGSGGMGGGMGMPGSTEMTSTVSASTSVSNGTRITLANGTDVIVSFIADKSVSKLTAGCSSFPSARFYTGGTVSGTPSAAGGSQEIYTSGTISGGSQV